MHVGVAGATAAKLQLPDAQSPALSQSAPRGQGAHVQIDALVVPGGV